MPRCRNSVAAPTDEQPHIGNYRLLKTIGKGNFAKVKLARHILTGKEVSSDPRSESRGGALGRSGSPGGTARGFPPSRTLLLLLLGNEAVMGAVLVGLPMVTV